MTKASEDYSENFMRASKKVKELGYANMLNLDVLGTKEHKLIIRNIYKAQ